MPQVLKVLTYLKDREIARFQVTRVEWGLAIKKLFLLDLETKEEYSLSALTWKVQHEVARFLTNNPGSTTQDIVGRTIEFRLLTNKSFSVDILGTSISSGVNNGNKNSLIGS